MNILNIQYKKTFFFLFFSLLLVKHPLNVLAKAEKPYSQLNAILEAAYPESAPGAAILVYKDGKVLLRKGYGLANVELNVPIEPKHRFRLASVTKQFTGIAVLKLVELGQLNLDADIRQYLPSFPDKGHKITLRQILGHTAGLANYTDNDDFEAAIHTNYNLSEIARYFQNEKLKFTPDQNWSYSNSGYALAAQIMEKVTGKEFTRLMDDLIFKPIGMNNSAFYDPTIIVKNTVTPYEKHAKTFSLASKIGTWGKADGGLYSTIDDMLKWYLALRDNKLVSEKSKRIAFSSNLLSNGEATKYGLGQFLGNIGDYKTIEHGGNVFGWNAYTIQVPSEDLFLVILSNQESGTVEQTALQVATASLGLSSLRPASTNITLATLNQLVGRYQHGPDDMRTITLVDGYLYSRRGTGEQYQLIPMGSHRFFFDDDPTTQIQFINDKALRIQYRNSMDNIATRTD